MTEPHENTPIAAPAEASHTPPEVSPPAEPPAAALVRDGFGAEEARTLRAELEAERKARAAAESGRKSAEFKAAEAERLAQELKAVHLAAPAPVPPKAKRGFPTLLNHPWKN